MPLNQLTRKNSNVLWTISVIQDITPDAQTKAEFAEMANDVLNISTIDTVTLCLADNLQRFRLMIEHDITEEEAIEECQKMSNIWQQDNSETIQKLKNTKNLSFITWQEFLQWPQYKQTLEDVEKFYRENPKFRHNVDGRIRQELRRIKNDAKIIDPTKQTELLKKYLFEECAFQKFAAGKRFHYEIYKNPFPPAMRDIKNNNNFVAPGFMESLHFTQFESNHKKQPDIKKEPFKTGSRIPYMEIPCGLDMPSFYGNKKTYHFPAEPKIKESESFSPLFGSNTIKSQAVTTSQEPSLVIRTAEFIEKTLALIPINQQEQAIQILLKFTYQEIVPLCYSGSTNNLKS